MAKSKKKRGALLADLKFQGGKFNAKGFPLDSIDELETYQNLVIEIAKKIWHDEHYGARVPGNFIARVRLRLVKVKRGSVIPVLEADSVLALPEAPDVLERSIEFIDEAFAEIVRRQVLPPNISLQAKQAFRMFGSTLAANEAAVFRASSKDPILYGRGERKSLLEALERDLFRRKGTLIGTLRVLDSAQAFLLIDAHGKKIDGVFSAGTVWDELHELHNRQEDADLIWVSCTYIIDDDDGSVVKIEDVTQAGLFARSDNPWAAPLAELAALPEGWMEGEGEHVELAPLEAALALLHLTDLTTKTPSIFADVEGGVRLEWLTLASHTLVSIDNDMHIYGYHLNIETGVEDIGDLVGVEAARDFLHRWLYA